MAREAPNSTIYLLIELLKSTPIVSGKQTDLWDDRYNRDHNDSDLISTHPACVTIK